MKEVIIATGTLGGGGAERVFMNIANELCKREINVRVLVTGSRPVQSYPLNDKISVDKIGSEKTNKVLKVLDKFLQFRRYLKKHEGSTIISFFPDVSAYCVFASIGIKNKNIVSERNDPYTIPRKKIMKKIRNSAFKYADLCVFQTEDAKKYFPTRVQNKSVRISNPIDVNALPIPRSIEERENIILAVGRIVPQKNFLMLIKAWEKIEKKFSDYVLHIYGDKTYRNGIFAKEIQQYIDMHNLKHRVQLMGFSEDIYTVMNQVTLYVSSSDFEGMSNTMLEAMAMGVPTIATDCPIGGARTVISNGENGILTPVGDTDKLAEEIEQVLENRNLMVRISKNALTLRNEQSIEKICDIWMKYL